MVLKLICDEQMESASASVDIYTTLREIHERLGSYCFFKKQPSPTDIRRTVILLEKHQMPEPLGLLEGLDSDSRTITYPCINVVLTGDGAKQLLASFDEQQEDEGIQEKADLPLEEPDVMEESESEENELGENEPREGRPEEDGPEENESEEENIEEKGVSDNRID